MSQLALFERAQLAEVAVSSDWCLRWTPDGGQAWRPARDSWHARTYSVKRITRDVAEAFVTARHYSGSHVACRRSYGLYRAGRLVGVAAYCVSAEQALTHAFPELISGGESLELGRFVLEDPEPANTETWFLARCREDLLTAGVRGVLSFADPHPRTGRDGRVLFPGHIGTIYQAGNFRWAGRNTVRTLWLLPDGTVLNGVTMQKIRAQKPGHDAAERMLVDRYRAKPMRTGQRPNEWLREVRNDPDVGIRLIRHAGCHRYLDVLGRNQRARKQILINPHLPTGAYPKRPDHLELAA